MIYKILTFQERTLYLNHLLNLDSESRILRFGNFKSDASITEYVNRLTFLDDLIIGVFDEENLNCISAAHISIKNEIGEIGISVDNSYRKKGIGKSLFNISIDVCRDLHCKKITTYCLKENSWTMNICKKLNMKLEYDGTDVFAYLNINKKPTMNSWIKQYFENQKYMLYYSKYLYNNFLKLLTNNSLQKNYLK